MSTTEWGAGSSFIDFRTTLGTAARWFGGRMSESTSPPRQQRPGWGTGQKHGFKVSEVSKFQKVKVNSKSKFNYPTLRQKKAEE
jgi:hypothetical protein